MVHFSLGLRRVLSAWALVLILIFAGLLAVELLPSDCFADATGTKLPGVRIPQYDPFDLGPPPAEYSHDMIEAR